MAFYSGNTDDRMVDLEWKSVGALGLALLPSLDERMWVPLIQKTDALLFGGGGGGVLYLCHWLRGVRVGGADVFADGDTLGRVRPRGHGDNPAGRRGLQSRSSPKRDQNRVWNAAVRRPRP